MGRRIPLTDRHGRPTLRAIPACVCDGCGIFGCGLHMAGSLTEPGAPCDCGGHQRHRELWRFDWRPACSGARCEACRWKGMVATPRE